MDDFTVFFWSAMFGVIGFGFFSYGKKQQKIVPRLAGAALMLFPYMVSSLNMLLIVGTALVVVPFMVKL